MHHNVLALHEVANFVPGYFRLLLNFLRKINVILLHNSQSRVTAVMPSVFYLLQYSRFYFRFRFRTVLKSETILNFKLNEFSRKNN